MESCKRNFFEKLIAIALVLVMVFCTPARAFAASNVYIKDVKLVYSTSASDAKWQVGKGYNVLYTPVYTSERKDQYGYNYHTYIAYQTTTNPEEAITDIRAMNMNGGWSYDKYKEFLQEQADGIEIMLTDLEIAIKEFRENYAAGKDSAIYAYNILQQYKEDDTNMLLGDFMLKKALEDHGRLSTFALQANAEAFCITEKALMIACQGTLDGTYGDRLSAANVYDYADSREYLGATKQIISGLTELQNAVHAYENSGYVEDVQSDEVIEEWLRGASTDTIMNWTQGKYLHEIMKAYSYKGMDNEETVYDLFMNHTTYLDANGNVVADFQPNVFNAAAAMMSDGQIAMLKLLGLVSFFLMENEDENAYTACGNVIETLKLFDSIEEPISVYDGVDRSVFNADGIAMTSAAMQQIAAGNETAWANKGLREDVKRAMKITAAAAGGVGTICAEIVLLEALVQIGRGTLTRGTTAVMHYGSDIALAHYVGDSTTVTFAEGVTAASKSTTTTLKTYFANLLPTIKGSGFLTVMSAVTLVAIGIMLLALCTWLIVSLIEDKTPPEWENIPRKIMNEVEIDGKNEYIYYDGVRQANRNEKTAEETNTGRFMDVGNWENESYYRQWVALYITKDPKAGKPILEKGFGVTSEPNTNVGFLTLKKFNEDTPYNLTTYCSTTKSYINYKVDTRYNPAVTATAFVDNKALAFGGGGVVFGLLAGLLVGLKSGKKKKANA